MKSTPIYWYNRSSDLRAIAGALYLSRRQDNSNKIVEELELGLGFSMDAAVGPVYTMLWGMAFELLFKGIIIAMKKDFPPSHNLETLANLAQLPLSAKEIGILQYLTECIIWDGRYPVPLEGKSKGKAQALGNMGKINKLANDFLSEVVPLGSKLMARKYNGALDWKPLNELWLRIAEVYDEKDRQWQESAVQ